MHNGAKPEYIIFVPRNAFCPAIRSMERLIFAAAFIVALFDVCLLSAAPSPPSARFAAIIDNRRSLAI